MLNPEEMEAISFTLNRNPTKSELCVLDALWSEHCSYKSSKRWFHLFKTEGKNVFLGIGEGAGLIDVGDDFVIGLGLESHNHPSAVDPYNGAATGVGGIIRDILSQGCRPIAILDCLRFGNPTTNRQKLLLDQVVLGISSYGNCVGIPNLGGDVEFATEFETNPLVNVMCVGIAKKSDIIRSIASNVGDKLLLFGSSTGRDGLGGVTFASRELNDKQQESRGSVQIGDPLTEKLLVDAVIEMRDKKLLSGLQDLGGGGLACAAIEMSEKGKTGLKLYLDEVPSRFKDMESWELLISESQERMLAVINEEKMNSAINILEKLEISWAIVGEVTLGNQFIGYYKDEIIANLPVDFTINGFPEPLRDLVKVEININNKTNDYGHQPIKLMSTFNLASRHPIYQQYDQHVQGNTVLGPGREAGVIKLPNEKLLTIACGTNSYLVSISNLMGSELATLSTIRKIISRGAKPIGMVDSINAGNPEKPSSYSEFVDMIKGVAKVSHEMNIPIVGGNVSLYNESQINHKINKILPSPFVGIVGIIEHKLISPWLTSNESLIILVGNKKGILKGSEFGRNFYAEDNLAVDYNEEKKLMNLLISSSEFVYSCTAIGKGGLFVTLAKWVIQSNVGIDIDFEIHENLQVKFGENVARYLLQIPYAKLKSFGKVIGDMEYTVVGKTNEKFVFKYNKTWTIEELIKIWEKPLEDAMKI